MGVLRPVRFGSFFARSNEPCADETSDSRRKYADRRQSDIPDTYGGAGRLVDIGSAPIGAKQRPPRHRMAKLWDVGMKEIGDGAFNGCTSLKAVNLPDSVKEIGDGAFNGCTSLKTVNLPDSVKEIGNSAFKGCTSLKKIAVPDSVTEIGSKAFNGCRKLTAMNAGKNVSKVGDGAFAGCTSLKKVTLSAKTSKIGRQAFKGTKKLKTLNIKSRKLTSKSISANAFKGIGNNVTIKVPKGMKKAYTALFRKKGLPKKVKIK